MSRRRAIVFGSRDFAARWIVMAVLNELSVEHQLYVVQGGARGADEIAHKWAHAHDVDHKTFHAAWKTHHPDWCDGGCRGAPKGYCSVAGHRRNQQMLDKGRPDLAIGFSSNKNLTPGTADMSRRIEKAGIPLYTVRSHS